MNRKWRIKSIKVKKAVIWFSHNFPHKLLLEQHCRNFRKSQNGWKGKLDIFQDGWKGNSDVRVDWRKDVAAWVSWPRGAWKLEPLGYVALEFCVGRHYSPVRSFHLSHTNHHERRIFFPPTFTLIPINFLFLNWIKTTPSAWGEQWANVWWRVSCSRCRTKRTLQPWKDWHLLSPPP